MESKDFKYKYLKYKQKYLDSVTEINRLKSMLNNQMGGAMTNSIVMSEQPNDPLMKINYLSETPIFQQGGRYTDISSSELHSANLESSELETFIKRNMVGGSDEDEDLNLDSDDEKTEQTEEDEQTEQTEEDEQTEQTEEDENDSDEEQNGGYSTSFTELDNIFGGAREEDSESDLSISSLDSTSLNSSDDEFNFSSSD